MTKLTEELISIGVLEAEDSLELVLPVAEYSVYGSLSSKVKCLLVKEFAGKCIECRLFYNNIKLITISVTNNNIQTVSDA